jgi:hypothetical protein
VRTSLRGSGFILLAGFVLLSGIEAAAQAPARNARDLSGVWSLKEGPKIPGSRQERQNGSSLFSLIETKLPLQPWALERCKTIGCGKDVNAFGWPTGEAADQTKDPYIMKCAPLGFPRVMLGTYEIFHVSGRTLMRFQQDGSMRDIWLDGRKHPEDAYGLWMGHSIGRWEGDTLIVDTVGIIDATWLDPFGTPHSDELHVVERFRRTGPNTLELEISFDDPKTFTAPFSGKLVFESRAGRELQPVLTCEDKILADNPADAWPFFVGEYPKIDIPDTVPKLKKQE